MEEAFEDHSRTEVLNILITTNGGEFALIGLTPVQMSAFSFQGAHEAPGRAVLDVSAVVQSQAGPL